MIMRKLCFTSALILVVIFISTGCKDAASPPIVNTNTPQTTSNTSSGTKTPMPTPTPAPTPTPTPTEAVYAVSDFSIIGAWKQTYGASGWASSDGRIVQFNDSHQSNIFSPQDTYGISNRGDGGFNLSVTGLLGGNLEYWVKVIDNDHIEVYSSNKTDLTFEFMRVE